MVQVTKFVWSTTSSMAHSGVTLPAPIIQVVTAFNYIHGTWRWYRLGKIYTNPDNFLMLALGHGLNSVLGKSLLFKISAQCILIATRMLECVEQQIRLQESWGDLVDAVKGNYATPITIRWETKSEEKFLSTSTIAWWKFHSHCLIDKIQRIAICLFHLCKEAFILSMRISDAVESFYLSPKTQNEGKNLIFVNSSKWIDKLVDNKPMLISGLISNKKSIDSILDFLKVPFTADQLINTAITELNQAEKIHKTVESFNCTVGEFIKACAKNWGYQFMYSIGFHNLVPKPLIPSSKLPWENTVYKKISDRYAPEDKLTKPSMLKKDKPLPELSYAFKQYEHKPQKHFSGTSSIYSTKSLPVKIPTLNLIDHPKKSKTKKNKGALI